MSVEMTNVDESASANTDKIQRHYHYKYDLMNREELEKRKEMSKYLLSIPPHDWAQIVGIFMVFYGLLVCVFCTTITVNIIADGTEALWTYFAMMMTTFVAIVIAVNVGECENKKQREAEEQKELSRQVSAGAEI